MSSLLTRNELKIWLSASQHKCKDRETDNSGEGDWVTAELGWGPGGGQNFLWVSFGIFWNLSHENFYLSDNNHTVRRKAYARSLWEAIRSFLKLNSPTLLMEWLRFREATASGQPIRPGLNQTLWAGTTAWRGSCSARPMEWCSCMTSPPRRALLVCATGWNVSRWADGCCGWPQFLKSRGNLYPTYFPFSPRITNDTTDI